MGHFVFIDYTGEDSGAILARILGQDGEDEHEVESETRRVVGFTPNPPDEEEDDPDEEEQEEDDESNTD